MKCSSCGTRNPKANRFCKECGEELLSAPQAAQTPPATTVIIREGGRRGIPCWGWILIGTALLASVIGLLVWLNIVELGYPLVIRLPSWLYSIVMP